MYVKIFLQYAYYTCGHALKLWLHCDKDNYVASRKPITYVYTVAVYSLRNEHLMTIIAVAT